MKGPAVERLVRNPKVTFKMQTSQTGTTTEDEGQLALGELARACDVHPEYIVQLVEEGLLEPVECDDERWRFRGQSLKHVRSVMHLQSDLGINLAGVGLALELMHELDELRAELDQARAGARPSH